jgi:hypothetical protein
MVTIRGRAKQSWDRLGYPELTDQLLHDDIMKFGQEEAAMTVPAPLEAGPTKAAQARALFVAKDWAGLHAFKKAAKKSWEVLGFNGREVATILANKE